MKREILCKPCSLKVAALNPAAQVNALDAALAAQEKVVKVYGTLTKSSFCDFCCKLLHPGDPAAAISIVPIGGHYYPWEADYLKT